MSMHNTMVPSVSTRSAGLLQCAAWAGVYFLVAAAVQAYISYPLDMDTAYHAAIGRLIRQHGILRSFPWTPFSWLADRYADKELLHHLLFAALAGMEWTDASRIVGTICGGALLTSYYLVLRAEKIPQAGLWGLLPLCASGYFVFRFGIVRPFIIAILLTTLLVWSVASNRTALTVIVAFLFPWSYVAFWQLPCVVLAAVETARLLSVGRVEWRPACALISGLLAGIMTHPNAGHLLQVSWINMTEMLFRNTWGGRETAIMGRELLPFTLKQWMYWLLVPVGFTLTALCVSWRQRRSDTVPFAFAVAALCFGLLTVSSGKFSEHFIPLSALALALASPLIRRRFLLPVVLLVSLVYTTVTSSRLISTMSRRPSDMPAGVAAVLQREIPPGAQVFTPDWDFTGVFMLALPERRFIVALDPTFFSVKDPRRYALWQRLVKEAPQGSAAIIRQEFGARYVLGASFQDMAPFYYRIASEPGVRTLLTSDTCMLFDLGPLSR
jgi:hypothetical protein